MQQIIPRIFKCESPTALICNGRKTSSVDTYTIIDPGFRPIGTIIDFIKQNQGILHSIMLTHGHTDHTHNLPSYTKIIRELTVIAHESSYLHLLARYGVKKYQARQENRRYVITSPDLRKQLGDIFIPVKDGDILRIGQRQYKFFHTPGHTPGEKHDSPGDDISIWVDKVLFLGDLLCHVYFIPQLCNFHYTSSLERLLDKDDYDWVCPGHGNVIQAASAKKIMRVLIETARQMERIAREMVENGIEQGSWDVKEKIWNYPKEVYDDFFIRLAKSVEVLSSITSEPDSLKMAFRGSLCRLRYALNCVQ